MNFSGLRLIDARFLPLLICLCFWASCSGTASNRPTPAESNSIEVDDNVPETPSDADQALPPFSIVEEEVTFTSTADGMELFGTLTMPEGKSSGLAAVVLVHGSGPQPRDGASRGSLFFFYAPKTIPFHKILAESLSSRGFAVLRYDKRTCVASNSDGLCPKEDLDYDRETVNLDMFAADVEGAVSWLRNREEIEGDKIVLLGHSQGANLVSRVAMNDGNIAGLILVGVPAPLDSVENFAEQERFILAHNKALRPSDELPGRIAELEKEIEIREEAARRIVADEYEGKFRNISPLFWRSWFKYKDDMREIMESLEIPVFAITGEYDFNTPATPHLQNIKAWRNNRENDVFITLPFANHALVQIGEEKMGAQVSDWALDRIAHWTGEIVGKDVGLFSPDELEKADKLYTATASSKVNLIRDTILCRHLEIDCDEDFLNASLIPAMSERIDATGILDSMDARTGDRILRNFSTVKLFYVPDEKIACKETLLDFEDDTAMVFRICWNEGPLLAGFFFL